MFRLNFLVCVVAFGSSALAFSPPSSMSASRLHSATQTTKTTTSIFVGLEVVDDESSGEDATPLSPFDAYLPTETQTEVAYKDTLVGSGYTVGEKEKQVLTIKYTAIFIDNDSTRKPKSFDFAENFVCKTGSNGILPGYEEGLAVSYLKYLYREFLCCGEVICVSFFSICYEKVHDDNRLYCI